MDKDSLRLLFNEFLKDDITMFTEEKTGDEWIKERKSIYELYRNKFSPHRVDQLTVVDFETFLTFKGNKSWTNLQRGCKRATQEIEKLKNSLKYLQNESIPIEDRLNTIARGGKFYIKGFGKNLTTGLLHIFNWEKYGVWNNRSQKVLEELRRLPYISSNFGQSYVRINLELLKLTEEINTDLAYLDAFLWWLDDSEKITQSRKLWRVG